MTVTAMYPCSGADLKPLTFTHPDFLRHRGVPMPSPNVLFYVDKSKDMDLRQGFRDNATSVESICCYEGDVLGMDAAFHVLLWSSITPPAYVRVLSRMVLFVQLTAAWEDAFARFAEKDMHPDILIGVCDGCRLGGNDHCVNELRLSKNGGGPSAYALSPDFLITDHFRGEFATNPLPKGGVVRSLSRCFPYRFEKLGLLSSDWGAYGPSEALGGATAFRVLPDTVR